MTNTTTALMLVLRLITLILRACKRGRDMSDAELNLALTRATEADERWEELMEAIDPDNPEED